MDGKMVWLTEIDKMCGDILVEVFQDNNITFVSDLIYKLGGQRSGKKEWNTMRFHVLESDKEAAEALLNELMSPDSIIEE